ncbi:hypothetical protein Q1695_004126 [Nippostrongylus brasiliensis]|nr:hypothetical protein Q1695_004126 [Nippostrongylus brasiliensis]
MVKWNATEIGCAFKINPKEDTARVICAYNVKGGVIGEAIYEKATGGNNSCDEGAQCGANGTCDNLLCNVPTSNPGKSSTSCYNPSPSWLDDYSRRGLIRLPSCSPECIDKEAQDFFSKEAKTNAELRSQCYKIRCPCLCKDVCQNIPGSFRMISGSTCSDYARCASAEPPTTVPIPPSPWLTTSKDYGASTSSLEPGFKSTLPGETSGIQNVDSQASTIQTSSTMISTKAPPLTTSPTSGEHSFSTDQTSTKDLHSTEPTSVPFSKISSHESLPSTMYTTRFSGNPSTADSASSLSYGTHKSPSTISNAKFTPDHETSPAFTGSSTSDEILPKTSVTSEPSSPFATLKPISTINTASETHGILSVSYTTSRMERKTTPALTKPTMLYQILSKTAESSTASRHFETQQSRSTPSSFHSPATTVPKIASVPTKPKTLYEILSKTSAASTSSLHDGTQKSPSTLSSIHPSSTVERKTTSVATTLYEIVSTNSDSSTSSLLFETRNSFSSSSATPTTERKTSHAASSPTLYEILSKTSDATISAVPFQTQEPYSSSSATVTIESETTPSTKSATLYEILSKSATSTTEWNPRSKKPTGEPFASEPSLSSSRTEQPVFTTWPGKITESPSPSESGAISSTASTPLAPEMETKETFSETSLPSETTVDREMASSTPVELAKTTYGVEEDMTVGTTQEGLEQSTDQAEATGTAQTTDTTVNHLEDPISTTKDSAESTRGNTAVYGYGTSPNKASTVTSTSYAEIYASTGILSTLLNRGKASTTSGQLESGDDRSTMPSEELSDPTLRRTVSPPAEPVAVPSSTSTFVRPSLDKTTLKFVLGGMDKSTAAPLTSKLFSTLRGIGNTTSLATPTHDSAVERSPATKPTAPDQDHSTPESMETQSAVRTTSQSSLQSTTRVADFQCAYPCPIGLLEGPNYCYQLLKAQPLLNYRKAFHLCAVEGGSDMADEVDLRDPQVRQLLRNASGSDGAETRFFVNERDSKQYMEEKKVRVVSLRWSTRFFLNVNETVRPRQYVENVTAACKRPKFCGEYYCNLNDYELLVPGSVLAIPETQNRTLAVEESVTIRCNNSETEVVKVQCRQKGYLKPHPTRVACQEDRKLAFLKRQRIRKSCKECFPSGTQKCERVPEGFVCRCRTNWTEPTCWRAPNLCEINQVDCGENGRCVSEITQARCICNASFAGSHCSVNKTKLSFISDTEASFVSGTTAGASIIAMTGSLVLLVRGLIALFYQQQGNDPQTFYQSCRCFFVALAGLFAFLFRHPALLQITQIQCMFSSFVMTCSFLFGMAFFALEALTFYECAGLTRLNSWTETYWGRNRFYTTPAFRTLTPLIVLTAAVAGTFKGRPADVASPWSCMGRFEPSNRNFWFPIALAHSCLGLAALAYTLEGRFKQANMPQFQQAVDEYLKPLPPARREEVEKCQRNHGLTAIGPWLLYTTWLFLALSADWVVSPTNYWAVACALGYSACELAIFALTTPQVYNAMLGTWTKLLPKRVSPAADPVPLRATVSSKMGKRLKRRWTAKYKKLREQNKNKTKAQIITMVFRKRVRHDLYHARNEACRRRIRRLFDEWWAETYTADRKPDAVLKLKTRLDMYLEERAAIMNNLVFLVGDRRGQAAAVDQQPQQPDEDCAIPLCYVSTVDDFGNTQIEEVTKTPAELADLPSTSRPQEEAADDRERGNVPNHEEPLAWIQELTDSAFKMAVQNYDYLERSRSLREWGPKL